MLNVDGAPASAVGNANAPAPANGSGRPAESAERADGAPTGAQGSP
jgi:hypothetical protein